MQVGSVWFDGVKLRSNPRGGGGGGGGQFILSYVIKAGFKLIIVYFTEIPKRFWHHTNIKYTAKNITNVYCEFYQYYPDASYLPEIYVFLDKRSWGLMVSPWECQL